MDEYVESPRRRGTKGLVMGALGAVATVVVVSCGTASGGDLAAGAPPATDRDAVIERWGDAVVRGDASTVVELLDPRSLGTMPAQDLEALESVVRPEGVEVHNFGYRIVSEDEHSAQVVYTGQRCAPTPSESFGPTTVMGDASGETSSSSTSTSTSTSVAVPRADGGIVCTDIEAASSDEPYRFVEVDGRWYGTIPGI